MSSASLSPNQVEAFRSDGFLVIEGFASATTCAELGARAAEIEADLVTDRDHMTVFSTTDQSHGDDSWFLESGDKVRGFFEKDSNRLNKIGHAMHDLDPVFDRFCRSPEMAAVASAVGLDDPLLVQSMYIFKHPEVGGEVTWHTDHTFLWTEPRSVVGFWLAVDDATVDNGCLWAIPGGHRIPPKSRFVRTGDRTHTEVFDDGEYPTEKAVPLEAPAGTLVLLDGALPHASEANRSERPRQAFTLHVTDRAATWSEQNWLQRPADDPFRGF